jgi:hypothetical protein
MKIKLYQIFILIVFVILTGCNKNESNNTKVNDAQKQNRNLKTDSLVSVDSLIKQTVMNWNNSISLDGIEELKNFYSEDVVYYGKSVKKSKVIEDKNKFLSKNHNFKQIINGNIEVDKLDEKEYKSKFTKRVTLNNKTTDYPSYLIISKSDTKWLINTEGDYITDYNLNKPKNEIYYYDPEISVLTGKIEREMFYEQPGYGETPKIDAKVYCYILYLDSPINVISKMKDEINVNVKNVKRIQLIIDNYNEFKKYIGNDVKVAGILSHSFTGHHHTDVLLSKVKILN